MEKSPLIYSRIAAIMTEIGPIAKDKTNKEQHYQFRGIDALMNAISPILAKHGVFPTTHSIIDVADAEVVSKGGSRGYRQLRRFTFRFFAEDGSFVDTLADGEAIDYGDKGSNKANSVAYREAMFKMFVVPFQDYDIENTDHDLAAIERPKTVSRTARTQDPDIALKASKERTATLLKMLTKTDLKTKKDYEEAVFDLTGYILADKDIETINEKLAALVEQADQDKITEGIDALDH
jgi:hypothetical protein